MNCCDRCPAAQGGNDCPCSRAYTREMVLFAWRGISAFFRGLDAGDWMAIAMVVVALGAVAHA